MHETTTIRVSKTTRDAVRALAQEDEVNIDEEIRKLTRAERQRRLGEALSAAPSEEDSTWLDAAADSVRNNAGG